MKIKQVNNKGKTKNLYPSELADMCKIKNVSDKAKESFKRKPYESNKCDENEQRKNKHNGRICIQVK